MDVWQIGREVARNVYAKTARPAFSKDHGLRDQMQRAAVSICSNIAEGYARRGNREFAKFLWIAKGSAAELQSQLYHALDAGAVDSSAFDALYADLDKLQVKLYRLIQTLSKDPDRTKL